jgi:hypothetical protein
MQRQERLFHRIKSATEEHNELVVRNPQLAAGCASNSGIRFEAFRVNSVLDYFDGNAVQRITVQVLKRLADRF